MTAPESESAPPTRKAVRARGMRMDQKMETIDGSMDEGRPVPQILQRRTVSISPGAIRTLPTLILSTSARRERRQVISIGRTAFFLSELTLLFFSIEPADLFSFIELLLFLSLASIILKMDLSDPHKRPDKYPWPSR